MDTKNMDTYCIGHVLRILDERTIIISAGNSTIAKGASIQVYEIRSEERRVGKEC